MEWENAPDIRKELEEIVRHLELTHVDLKRVTCFRSFGSTSRARARIWSLPRVWQLALQRSAAYIIEVISERFDKLSRDDQKRVLIHELLHIPKNFSGSLLPHWRRGVRFERMVENLFSRYKKAV